jgi:predicted DNA binding protein
MEFDHMRKLTIEMEPDEMYKDHMREAFQKIESYEILETLKIDYEEGICVDLIEVTTRKGIDIRDVKKIDKMEIVSILRSEGNKHTCLSKYFEVEENMEDFKMTDLDLIQSTPTIISQDKITATMIGENENLNKFINSLKEEKMNIINLTITKAAYHKHDLLSILTEKQRDILSVAHKNGYYDYPKKINGQQLAEKTNISKATLVQHLRKAESRLMDELFLGRS